MKPIIIDHLSSIQSIIALSLLQDSWTFQNHNHVYAKRNFFCPYHHPLSIDPLLHHCCVQVSRSVNFRKTPLFCSSLNHNNSEGPYSSGQSDGPSSPFLVSEEEELFVTDEEALLACRAYLQRKNKLGWIESKQRKTLAKQNFNAGYFWEDPDELVYLKRSRPRRLIQKNKLLGEDGESRNSGSNNEDDSLADNEEDYLFEFIDDFDDNEDDIYTNEFQNDGGDNEENTDIQVSSSESSNDSDEGGIFTSFPAYPPARYLKQSQFRKKLFSNPEWKEEWYNKRWGGEDMKKERERVRQNKKIQKLVQKIPSDVLRSPELAALTDEEIEDAIKTYLKANQKRRKSHLNVQKEKSDGLGSINIANTSSISSKSERDKFVKKEESKDPTPRMNRNELLSFSPSEDQLKEAQRRNSERARKAYETRMINNEMKGIDIDKNKQLQQRNLKEIKVEGKLSPRQSMERIEEMINDKKQPYSHDIDTVLEPKRLAGRKELFRMILRENSGLKGKCVPDLSSLTHVKEPSEFYLDATADDVDAIVKKFVTQSTVSELGLFIKFLLK